MAKTQKKGSAKARRKAARLVAVQVYYQTYNTDKTIRQIVGEALDHHLNQEVDGHDLVTADAELLSKLVQGVDQNLETLSDVIQPHLNNRMLGNMDELLQSILLMGAYELVHHADIDAPILINDYVDVANAFYDKKEANMVNAILDKVKQSVREPA